MKRSAALLFPLAVTFGLVACGDDDDGGGDAADSDSEWCDLARDVEAQDDLLSDVDFTDPDAMRSALDDATGLMDDAVDVAPDEIADDVEATSNAFNEYREILADADYDIMDVDTAAFENIGTEVEDASERIDAYNERVCGMESDGTDDTVVDEDTDDSVVDDGSDDGSDTTDAASATLPAGGTLNEQLVQQFTAMGMSEEEAQCLVDTIDMQEFAESQDTTMLLEAFEECGIDPTALGG
jgi:hypothetical protein